MCVWVIKLQEHCHRTYDGYTKGSTLKVQIGPKQTFNAEFWILSTDTL